MQASHTLASPQIFPKHVGFGINESAKRERGKKIEAIFGNLPRAGLDKDLLQ